MDRTEVVATARRGVGHALNAVRRSLPTSGPWMAVEVRLRRAHAHLDRMRHHDVDGMQRWGPVLAGAPKGHFVAPRRAIEQSRHEAARWASGGYVGAGAHVLDVGSGNGRQAIGLLDEGIDRYVGLEVIRECVAYCSQAFDDTRCDFVHLDVRNKMYNPHGEVLPHEVTFPFEDQEFDFVVAGSLYTHLEDLPVARRYAEETHRVMRAGGHGYMSWFVSPPNAVSSNPKRTVYPRHDVDALLADLFEVVDVEGGGTTHYHDQLRVVVRRA